MLTASRPAPTQTVAPTLQDGEEVLWTEKKSRIVDFYVVSFLLVSIPFLFIYGMYVWDCLAPGGATPEDWHTMLFLPGIALLCLLAAGYQALSNHRTTYVLTRKRAIIVTTSPLGRCKARAAAIAPGMVQEVTRHKDGTASYVILEQKVGHMRIPEGFEHVRSVPELETHLRSCGVQLPQPTTGNKKSTSPKTSHLLYPLLLAGLAVYAGVHEWNTDPQLPLSFFGESTTATITAHETQVRMTGRRRFKKPATFYHPVLQFRTADGLMTTTTDQIGDLRPIGAPGDRVEILYDPQQPTHAMRAASNRFERPAVILLLFLASLGALVYNLHRLCRYRRTRQRP